MSTLSSATVFEIQHFQQFREHIPGYENMDIKTLNTVANMGGLQVSTLMELAIANISGWLHESLQGRDFADGSDAKYVTCRTHSNSDAYGARIGKLHNKKGDLRVQVLNPKGDHTGVNKFYWFIIPYKEYQHIKTGSGNLEIPFHTDGTPDRLSKNRSTGLSIWIREVPSFERCAHSTSTLEEQKRRPTEQSLFTYA
jgi:hypothetical protein